MCYSRLIFLFLFFKKYYYWLCVYDVCVQCRCVWQSICGFQRSTLLHWFSSSPSHGFWLWTQFARFSGQASLPSEPSPRIIWLTLMGMFVFLMLLTLTFEVHCYLYVCRVFAFRFVWLDLFVWAHHSISCSKVIIMLQDSEKYRGHCVP